MPNGTHKSIRVSNDTFDRLAELATPFPGSELGTPDKVIAMLLDFYAEPWERDEDEADEDD